MTEEFEERIRGLKELIGRVQGPREKTTTLEREPAPLPTPAKPADTVTVQRCGYGGVRMKRLVVCVSLAMAIGGAYYNALGNGFVFDDYLLGRR